jgi:signal transduction histidine kinase
MNIRNTLDRVVSGRWYVPAILAMLLTASSFYSYLLFHTVVELFCVLVAIAALIVTWQANATSRNSYLTMLVCGYFWIGMLDFVHTLAYKGMNVLPSVSTSNEPTQLWIAARYSEAVLLLAAPFFLIRPMRRNWIFALFGLIALTLLGFIMSGNFPDCFVEGKGLTPFKIYSEYLIIVILVSAMATLWRRRALVDESVWTGILLANVFTIGAEFCFTKYASVYGPANLFGHVFKLFAFWMIYTVLVESALRRPEVAIERKVQSDPPVTKAFWLQVAASVLIPIVTLGIVAWQSHEVTTRDAKRDVQRFIEIFYNQALNVLQTQELISERVSERLAGMTWDEIDHSKAIQDYLKGITDNFPQAQAIWLADSTGRVRNASQPLPPTVVSVADRDYFNALRGQGPGTAIGELVQARVMKEWNFNIARRRINSSGSFDGVVIVTIFEDYFSAYWNRTIQEADTVVALVRGDGKFLARAPQVIPNAMEIAATTPLMQLSKNASQGAYQAVSQTDSIERFYAFRKLPKYDVILVFGRGVETSLAEWRNNLLLYAALFGSSALALLMLVLFAQRSTSQAHVLEQNAMLERSVQARTAELQAANKELEAFAYSVSHDLRAPLRHIDGFLDLLRARTTDTLDDKSMHYMNTISDAARRMGTLIDDLLGFSRMGRKEMATESVRLDDLLHEVIHEFDPETQGRDIDWRIAHLPMVTGDRAMLHIVLVNLISNALKFTQKRAKAVIEVGSLLGATAETVIFVRDNGAGFDMRYADKLFGVFQRLHASDEFEGTGIGLANVRRVISRHGGRTWAEGKVDGGASFYFSLPQVRSAK